MLIAAIAWGNGIAMRAGSGMAEEAADALVKLRTNDVLEFTGLRVRFVVINAEGVFKQALGEAMAADDVARAALATISQKDFVILLNLYKP